MCSSDLVAQHLGNNEVRCLMLAASEGLHKDMEVTKNLRKKIEENPEEPHYIETIRGVGYRFRA